MAETEVTDEKLVAEAKTTVEMTDEEATTADGEKTTEEILDAEYISLED